MARRKFPPPTSCAVPSAHTERNGSVVPSSLRQRQDRPEGKNPGRSQGLGGSRAAIRSPSNAPTALFLQRTRRDGSLCRIVSQTLGEVNGLGANLERCNVLTRSPQYFLIWAPGSNTIRCRTMG